ncbi:PQQ-binding-like beta-propeller repeat protein [Hyphomicrobium sp.]|uniref:pyrroloquinoline quinone-dependent dehydrogenase n=1 Tax=Hyphomicrobium sp. TaxID=82 RepID=UPI0025C55057|nr:PQQ-binding-like beta-propeller repeat protein [Hyphomicrobium sp.]MCC7251732.1 PQQ-binding-like beta-propeller repeat protein [Hyphomicrobium sp.]
MHSSLKLGFLLPALLALAFGSSAALSGDIDDGRLKSAGENRGDWLLYGRDYGQQRFSPLDQINVATLNRLVPKWIYQTGSAATFQTSPLIADGVMYLTAPNSHVIAVDAKTGRERWRYDHKRASEKTCCGPANRGAAIGYGKVYVATVDARLVALDQSTGKPLWDIALAEQWSGATEDKGVLAAGDPLHGRNITGSTGAGAVIAPLVYDGKVIVGITGVGYGLHLDSPRPGAPLGAVVGVAGRYGRPGFLAAYDAETGKEIWKFETTQEGWEGSFRSETPDGVPLNRDIAAEKASLAQHADAWQHGGGSIWHTPAVDTATGLLYFGVGNPSPQAADSTRPGDNLYTVSLVALEAATGKLVWHYQQVPHDMWGYDVASPPTLFDVEVDGKTVPAVGEASKLGWYYVHDRRSGELLFKSDAFVPQDNLFARPTPQGVRVSPGPAGGSNWSPASLDASRGIVYVAGMHVPMIYRTDELPADGDKPAVPYFIIEPSHEENWGTLTALDLTRKGRIAWQTKTDQPLVGGVLATAGGLVFTGEGGGDFSAFDAKTGAKLWSFSCGAGVNAPPVSYELDGEQYIAVAAGGSQIWGFRQGGAVVVFGLTKE